MQAGVAAMNAERARREQLPIRIGVGVNTGVAVAGNMGSPQRLNYTVLGEAVNLASRLCAAASPGQVLTTRGTIAAAGESVRAVSLGERAIKGFSTGIEVLAVRLPGGKPGAARMGQAFLDHHVARAAPERGRPRVLAVPGRQGGLGLDRLGEGAHELVGPGPRIARGLRAR